MVKHHFLTSAIAGVVALAVSAGVLVYGAQHYAGLKHAWPALDAAQKNDLAGRFKAIPGLKLDIVCGDAACSDLAQDIPPSTGVKT